MSTIKEQVDQEIARYEKEHGQAPNVVVLGRHAYGALKAELGVSKLGDELTHYGRLQLANPFVVSDYWLVSVTYSNQSH